MLVALLRSGLAAGEAVEVADELIDFGVATETEPVALEPDEPEATPLESDFEAPVVGASASGLFAVVVVGAEPSSIGCTIFGSVELRSGDAAGANSAGGADVTPPGLRSECSCGASASRSALCRPPFNGDDSTLDDPAAGDVFGTTTVISDFGAASVGSAAGVDSVVVDSAIGFATEFNDGATADAFGG